MSSFVRRVRDLHSCSRKSLEEEIGLPLKDNQQIFIVIAAPGIVADDETRLKAAAEIEKTIVLARRNADAQGVTEEAIDAAVEEAMRRFRPRYAG